MFHRQSLGKSSWFTPKSKRFNLLKVEISPPKNSCIICLTEIPLKMMKNAFYFILMFLLFRKNGLIRKIKFTLLKFMMSQPRLQTIAIRILPNIWKSKNNQTMKFVQLIEYNKINIFPQNLCGKWGRETSTRPLFIF